MRSITINITPKAVGAFALSILIGLVMFRSPILHAQSTSPLSGTFICLTNKNLAGYTNAATTWAQADVNQLFTITFDGSTSATVSSLVINTVKKYEQTDAYTSSVVSTTPKTLTVSNPSQHIYKLVEAGKEQKPNYVGLANSGNTLLVLASPQSIDSPNLNGVCQKV